MNYLWLAIFAAGLVWSGALPKAEDGMKGQYSCNPGGWGVLQWGPVKPYLFFIALVTALASPCLAGEGELRNWFNDPFFQISNAIADCPIPRGPFATDKERLANAHHRAERGTTCWLVGKCDRPTSYAYDRDIADAFKTRLAESNPFAGSTTLWVTVQGRVVYIEGCAEAPNVAREAEGYAMALPYVEIAVAHLRTDPAGPPPYGVMSDAAAPPLH